MTSHFSYRKYVSAYSETIVLVVSGLAGIYIGYWLPWYILSEDAVVVVLPGPPRNTLLGVPTMVLTEGLFIIPFGYPGLVLLGVLGSVLVAWLFRSRTLFSVTLGGIAATSTSLSAWEFFITSGADGVSRGWIFGPGVFLAIGGSLLLLLGAFTSCQPGRSFGTGTDSSAGSSLSPFDHDRPTGPIMLAVASLGGLSIATRLTWFSPIPLAGPVNSPTLLGLEPGLLPGVVAIIVLIAVGVSYWHGNPDLGGVLLCLTGIGLSCETIWQYASLRPRRSREFIGLLLGPGGYLTLASAGAMISAGSLLLYYTNERDADSVARHRNLWSADRGRRTQIPFGTSVLVLIASSLVWIGTRFDWLLSVPGTSGIPADAIPTMEVGLLGSNDSLLACMAIGVVVSLGLPIITDRNRVSGHLLFVTGIFVVLQLIWRIVNTAGTDGIFADAFILGPGPYFVLLGGTFLTIVGSYASILHGRHLERDHGRVDPDNRSHDTVNGS